MNYIRDWYHFYRSRVGQAYADYCRENYRVFIDCLLSVNATAIREEGCGIGTMLRVLREESPYSDYEGFDLNPRILKLAEMNLFSPELRSVKLFRDNILDPIYSSSTELIFSHGVLEHFNDREIKRILRRQKKEASFAVIHYVPTDRWNTPSYGDERLLPIDYWKERFQPNEILLWNEGKDAVLVWKLKN